MLLADAEPRVRVPPGLETDFAAGIIGTIFSDSGLLAVSLGDGTVQLLAPDGNVRSVQAHEGAILCLALDIDGEGFVTGGDDGRLVRSSPEGSASELLSVQNRQIDVLAVSRPGKTRAVAIGKTLLHGPAAQRLG